VTSLGITSLHGRPAPDTSLRDLVERLPGHLREAVLLHYYADLPVAEVAAALRRPVGTVKRRLHEARALLSDAVLASERTG
jgi:RNA polymerase sigma-70 factor (ECF subfamily)